MDTREALVAMAREPLLTAQEESELALLAEAGALASERLEGVLSAAARPGGVVPPADLSVEAWELAALAAEGERAFDRLVAANVRLVAWCARRRRAARATALDEADLIAEGMAGLVRAAHKFDYTRGLKFSTYAVPWILSYQGRAARRAAGIPVRVYEQQQAIRRTREQLAGELHRQPTADEVADRVGLSPARIAELETYREARSLDAGTGDRGRSGHDTVADATWQGTTAQADDRTRGQVADLLGTLPARQQRVLALHFGLDGEPPATVGDIARACGVSAARAKRTLDDALTSLRSTTGATATSQTCGIPDPP